MHHLLTRLGLTWHPEKTRMVDARREPFVFLGHTHRRQSARLYLDIGPKPLRRIRDELRRRTRHTGLSLDQVLADLNPYIRGARHYFRLVRRRLLSRLDFFVDVRLARWLARKHHLLVVPPTPGLDGERQGKPYAGNPHVRFDERLLGRASRRRAGVYSTAAGSVRLYR